MKTFFEFLGYWWKNFNGSEQLVIIISFSLLMIAVSIYFFGAKVALFATGWILVLGVIGHVLYSLVSSIFHAWRSFTRMKEVESQSIVDRLKGTRRS